MHCQKEFSLSEKQSSSGIISQMILQRSLPRIFIMPNGVLKIAEENFQNMDDLGFIIMHRCGENYLLLVCTWRNENELWESVYYDGSGKFEIWDRNKTHLPTYCVWEMGIVYHESQSWKKFLGSEREEKDQEKYLNDFFEGEV